jgi:hypothetical protein
MVSPESFFLCVGAVGEEVSSVSLIALLGAAAAAAGSVGSGVGESETPPFGLFSLLCVGTALIVGSTCGDETGPVSSIVVVRMAEIGVLTV